MYIYIYIHRYIYIDTHIDIHIHIHIHICIYIHTYIHIYIHMHMHMYVYDCGIVWYLTLYLLGLFRNMMVGIMWWWIHVDSLGQMTGAALGKCKELRNEGYNWEELYLNCEKIARNCEWNSFFCDETCEKQLWME